MQIEWSTLYAQYTPFTQQRISPRGLKKYSKIVIILTVEAVLTAGPDKENPATVIFTHFRPRRSEESKMRRVHKLFPGGTM